MADTFETFTTTGTFTATATTPAASLSGTLTVDETTGRVTAADLVAGSLPAFTTVSSQIVYSTGEWQVTFSAPAPMGNYELTLIFTTPNTADVSSVPSLDSLMGFNGGTIFGATDSVDLNGTSVLFGLTGTISPEMVTINSGQTYTVSSGQTDIGDIVLYGGTLDVLSPGARRAARRSMLAAQKPSVPVASTMGRRSVAALNSTTARPAATRSMAAARRS
jgi:hypothetical protein